MNSNELKGRKIVTPCYNHLGGILGEALFTFLVKEKWIQKDKNDIDYNITQKGWEELEIFGIDIEKLRSTEKKIVTACIEQHYGIYHKHTGALLGSLITDLLIELGWIAKKQENQLKVTKKGLHGLNALGVNIKNIIEIL